MRYVGQKAQNNILKLNHGFSGLATTCSSYLERSLKINLNDNVSSNTGQLLGVKNFEIGLSFVLFQ